MVNEADGAPRGPLDADKVVKPKIPVSYTQNNKKTFDPSKVDKAKPYFIRYDDNTVKAYQGTEPILDRKIAPPKMPTANLAPTVTPEVPGEAEAAPRIPSFAPFVSPSTIEETWQSTQERSRASLATTIAGRYTPGTAFDNLFDSINRSGYGSSTKVTWNGMLEEFQGEQLLDAVTTGVYDSLVEQEPRIRDAFIGAVASSIEDMPPQVRISYDVAIGREEGDRELFRLLSRYLINNPDALTDEVREFYTATGVFNEDPQWRPGQKSAAAQVASQFPWIGNDLSSAIVSMENANRLAELAATFTGAVEREAVSGGTANILYPVLQQVITNHIKTYDEAIEAEITNVGSVQRALRANPEAPQDMFALNIDASTIEFARWVYPELARLSTDTLVRALAISPSDLGETRNFRPQDITSLTPKDLENYRRMGLFNDPATSHWLSLGLSLNQVATMWRLVTVGLEEDIPRYVREIPRRQEEARRKEREAQRWIADNGIENADALSPARFGGLPFDTYLSLGVSPSAAENLAGFRPILSSGATAARAVWDAAGDFGQIIDRTSGAFEFETAEQFYSDPEDTQGFRVQRTFTDFFSLFAQAGEGQIPTAEQSEAAGSLASWDTDWRNGHQPNSPLRHRLTDLWNRTSDETHWDLARTSSIYRPERGTDGAFYLPQAEEFLSMVENIVATKGVDLDTAVQEAAAAARGGDDLIFTVLTDTYNLIDIPGVSALLSQPIRGARYATTGVDGARAFEDISMFGPTSPIGRATRRTFQRGHTTIRGSQVADPNVTRLLRERADELTARLTDKVVTVKNPDGSIVLRNADGTKTTANVLEQYRAERSEIENVLKFSTTAKADDTYNLSTTIRHPLGGVNQTFDVGTGLIDVFRKGRVIRRAMAPYTQGTRRAGEVIDNLTVPLHRRILDSIKGGHLRASESGIRAQAAQDVTNSTEVIQWAVGRHPARRANLKGNDLRLAIRGILNDTRASAQSGDLLTFVRNNGLGSHLTEDVYRGLEVLSDVDIDKLVFLSDDINIASDTDDYTRLLAAADDVRIKKGDKAGLNARARVFRDDIEWAGALYEELAGHVQRTVNNRYGLGDDSGLMLWAQNKLNGLLSMFYLESPGYVVRNFMSNISAASVDGFNPRDAVFGNSDARRLLRQIQGSDPLVSGFGVEGRAVVNIADLQAVKNRISGEMRSRAWRTSPRNTGIPFVTTAFPGISFRAMAARDEQIRRSNLVSNDFFRHMTQYKENLRNTLGRDAAFARLAEKDPELAAGLIDSLADVTLNDETVALLQYGDGPLVRVETRQRAQRVAERLGILTTDVDPAIWSAADELLNDPLSTPEGVTRRITEMRDNFNGAARQIAEELNMPPQMGEALTGLFTDIYRHALAEGLTGQDAGNIGRIVATEISKALPYVFQKSDELTQFLTNPTLYKNNVFGTILDGQFVDLAEFREQLVALGGRTQSMTDLLHSEGGQQTLAAIDDLIDEGRQITDVTTGNPVLIQRAARRSEELFEEIKAEIVNRDALTVVRRATPRKPRAITTRPIHMSLSDAPPLNRTQFFRAKRDLDGALTRFSRIMVGMNENFTKNELFSSAYNRFGGNTFIDEAKAELDDILASMNQAQRKDALARIRKEMTDDVGTWQSRKSGLITALERETDTLADELAAEAAEAERIRKLGPSPSQQRLQQRRDNIRTTVDEIMADTRLSTETRLDRIVAEYSTLFGSDGLTANMNSGLLRMVRNTDPTVTSGQVFAAFQRGVRRGFIRLVPDEKGQAIRFVRTGVEGMDNDTLRSKFDELYTRLNTVADAVAARRMENAKGTIEEFRGWVDTEANRLISTLRRTATNDAEKGILVSATPPQTALGGQQSPTQAILDDAAVVGETTMTKDESHRISSRYLNFANEEIRRWSDSVGTRYNEVATPLGLPPAPVGKGDEAAVAGRYTGSTAPNALVEFYANNLPYRWLFEDLDSTFKSSAAEQVGLRRRLNNFLYDDTEFMDGVNITLDEAIAFANDPTSVRETKDIIDGLWTPIFFRDRALTPPPGVEIGPVIPAMVDGRKASHRAPVGYRTVIVGDTFFGREAQMGRYTMHVSADATEEQIRDMAERLNSAHHSFSATLPTIRGGQFPRGFDLTRYVEDWAATYEDDEIVEWVRHYAQQIKGQRSPNRVANNPTGFRAAPPVDAGGQRSFGETFTYVKEQLAPYVRKWQENGDVAARETFLGAVQHRLAGWPIAGDRRGARRTFETFDEAGQTIEKTGARTLDDIYNYYRVSFNTSGQELLSARTRGIDPETLREVAQAVSRVKKESSTVALYAMRQARARADWVLHNYTATNDLDFLLRWIGPWHIWPTRTAAKIGTRLIDDPRWFSAYAQYRNVTEDPPEGLPDWAKVALNVSFLRGPLSYLFEGLTGADLRLNTNAITFWDGIFSDYEIGEEAQHNGIARFVNAIDKLPITVNPLFKHGLVYGGAYGDVDIADYTEQSFARGTRAILGIGDAIGLDQILGNNYPHDIFTSQKDRNLISLEYVAMAMEAAQQGNQERAQAIRDSAMMYARNGHTVTGSWLSGITNAEMRRDPIYNEVIDRAYGRGRALPHTTSYFGARISGYTSSGADISGFFEKAEELEKQRFATEEARDAARDELWNNSPYAEVYMLTRGNLDGSQMRLGVAKSEWFTEIKNINQEYEIEMASIAPGDVAAQREALHRKWQREVELAQQIEDETGYNPQSAPEFEFNRTLEPTALDPMGNNTYQELMDFGARNLTNKDILENLSPETKLALVGTEWWDAATTLMDEMGLLPVDVTYIQNAIKPPIYLSYVAEWVQSELDANQFRIDAYHGTRLAVPTNAIDINAYMANKERVYAAMPGDLRTFVQQHLRRFHTPQIAVDDVLLELVGERSDEVWAIRRDDGLTPDEKHIREMELLESYKLPSVTDVLTRFNQNYGEPWFTFNDVDTAELSKIVLDRIKHAENLAHLDIYMDGNWQRRVDALTHDLVAINQETDPTIKAKFQEQAAHFVTPSGYVVHDERTLEEFRKAMIASELVRNAQKNGITGFYLEASLYPEYYMYFVPQGDRIVELQKTIDAWTSEDASDEQKDHAYNVLIPQRDALIGREESTATEKGAPVRDATGTSRTSTSRGDNAGGVPSVGTDVRRTNSNYRLEYISPTVSLSRAGTLTRNFLVSKYFSGSLSDEVPPDWVFEHLGRNGVAEQSEIVDFFNSLKAQFKGSLAPLLESNQAIADAMFAIENETLNEDGTRRVPTWRYIKGIEAMLSVLFGTPMGAKGKVSLTGLTSDEPERKRSALPSNSGTGRLPRWDEAVGYVNNIFHDPTLLLGLNDLWSKRKPLSRNHQRMLRYMYRSFPLGLDLTFDEWMSALKLMWQTSALTPPTNTSVNPAGRNQFDSPRFARFTQS